MGLLAREVTAPPSVTDAGAGRDPVVPTRLFPMRTVVYRRSASRRGEPGGPGGG